MSCGSLSARSGVSELDEQLGAEADRELSSPRRRALGADTHHEAAPEGLLEPCAETEGPASLVVVPPRRQLEGHLSPAFPGEELKAERTAGAQPSSPATSRTR